MSIVVTTDVFCDWCPVWTSGTTGRNRIRARLARRNARENGWATKRSASGWVDLCPDCLELWEQELRPRLAEGEIDTDVDFSEMDKIDVIDLLDLVKKGEYPYTVHRPSA